MQNIYTLRYHLKKTENPRLKQKIKKIVDIMPKISDNIRVVYTKRKIWFLKGNLKFMHIQVEKKLLNLKIKTNNNWNKIKLKNSEDLNFFYSLLDKIC